MNSNIKVIKLVLFSLLFLSQNLLRSQVFICDLPYASTITQGNNTDYITTFTAGALVDAGVSPHFTFYHQLFGSSIWSLITTQTLMEQGDKLKIHFENTTGGTFNMSSLCDAGANTTILSNSRKLPISFGKFRSEYTSDRKGHLIWNTTTEYDNLGFYINESPNGINWTNLGFVKSQAPNGNSITPLLYEYIVKSYHSGIVYFKIIQRGINGDEHTYPVDKIIYPEVNKIKIYPNPVVNNLFISNPEQVENLFLFDLFGKKLNVAWNDSSMDLSNVPFGVYLLKLKQVNGSEVTLRVIVNK